MKKILKVVVALVLFVLLALLLSPLWIGPVTCSVANWVVPQKTGTPFRLGEFGLNGYTGRLRVGNVQLENPAGCEQRMATTLGKLDVDVDVASLLSDTIIVENIELKDLFVSYVSDDKGRNNFEVILENASGKPTDGNSAETKPAEEKPAEKKSDKPAKKIIIDRLTVSGIVVQIGKLTLPTPTITLTGIGRSSNGATPEQVWSEISAKVMQSLGMFGEGLKGLGEQAKNLSGGLKNIGQEGGAKAVETLDAAAGSASEAAGKAKKALGGAADSAGKAVESLKGLFN